MAPPLHPAGAINRAPTPLPSLRWACSSCPCTPKKERQPFLNSLSTCDLKHDTMRCIGRPHGPHVHTPNLFSKTRRGPMPRGRKRSPQDSIDSILLAMSRRSDIDPDTLSHYFDRLDEEWTDGARDKVLHLLRTNDVTAHTAAVLILSELATDFDLEELEDFVADPTVGDLAKLTLAPVLNELDSEMADEGIIDYLNDPETAMLQMQIRLLELVGQSELGVESVLEDVLSMPVER